MTKITRSLWMMISDISCVFSNVSIYALVVYVSAFILEQC